MRQIIVTNGAKTRQRRHVMRLPGEGLNSLHQQQFLREMSACNEKPSLAGWEKKKALQRHKDPGRRENKATKHVKPRCQEHCLS